MYEYFLVQIDRMTDLGKTLNNCAQKGWRFVAFVPGGDSIAHVAVMERQQSSHQRFHEPEVAEGG